MPFYCRAVIAISLFLALAATPAHAQTAYRTKVTFLLVNDIYLMGDQAGPDGKKRGGFARLAAVVNAERAKGGHVILAHGGDTLSPSLMSSIDKGAHIITLTNMVPPDIFAPGNHEFDAGKANFLQRIGEAKFPTYAANLRLKDGSPVPNVKDNSIVTYDGVRIGMAGLTYPETPSVSSPEDLKFTSAIETAKTQDSALRNQGADFVLMVGHITRGDALAMQQDHSGDLILTGHTHDLFINFDELGAIVESKADGQYITAVDADIQVSEKDGKRRMRWWPQFRVIDSADVTPDAAVSAKVAEFQAALDQKIDIPIGTVGAELDSRGAVILNAESAIGNLIADAMRLRSKADIGFMNSGGIRANKVYAVGSKISRKDLIAEMPFGNHVLVAEMTGKVLKDALEHGFAHVPAASGRFPQISGMNVVYDPSKISGQRVVEVKVGGAPLDEAKVYKIATNDFTLRGGDGYTMFKTAKVQGDPHDAPVLAEEVCAHIEQLGTVNAKVEGRIVAK